MNPQLPPPRFRVVLELTFPEADPSSAAQYHRWLERLKEALEQNSSCRCADVAIREALTIPQDGSDYEDWRRQRGEYARRQEDQAEETGGDSGSVAPVMGTELKRVWNLTQNNDSPEVNNSIAEIIQQSETDPQAHALLARTLVLNLLQQRGVLAKWREQGRTDDSVFEKIAALPIEEWSREHLESIVRQLEGEK